jgi:Domain of unknown function (DUF4350)
VVSRARTNGAIARSAAWLLLLVLFTTRSHAAAFDLNDATWEGCAELLGLARKELGKERVVVLSTLDWEAVQAGDGILVVHPERPMDAEEAAAFMKAGGRMAILDDYGKGDRLLNHFKIRRRSLPAHPINFLRNKTSLPVATPAFDMAGGEVLGLHPTVADVKQVVLNHGTGLRHPDLTPVLEVRVRGGKAVPVAVAGQIDGPQAKGRLFAMGDPSAFINMMLRYPGNRAFAVGLVHYLADGDATEARSGRLFIVANEFGERGSFGGVTPLRKTIDRKLEALMEALHELRLNGFPWWLHMLVAAATALAVLWWVLRALVRLYKSRLPRFARTVPLVAQGGVAGRVAVLSSDVSPPALALLEVRSALVEALASHLSMSDQTPASALLSELDKRHSLASDVKQRASNMLSAMSAAETAVVAGSPPRVGDDEVRAAASLVDRLLDDAGVDIPWPSTFRR